MYKIHTLMLGMSILAATASNSMAMTKSEDQVIVDMQKERLNNEEKQSRRNTLRAMDDRSKDMDKYTPSEGDKNARLEAMKKRMAERRAESQAMLEKQSDSLNDSGRASNVDNYMLRDSDLRGGYNKTESRRMEALNRMEEKRAKKAEDNKNKLDAIKGMGGAYDLDKGYGGLKKKTEGRLSDNELRYGNKNDESMRIEGLNRKSSMDREKPDSDGSSGNVAARIKHYEMLAKKERPN